MRLGIEVCKKTCSTRLGSVINVLHRNDSKCMLLVDVHD